MKKFLFLLFAFLPLISFAQIEGEFKIAKNDLSKELPSPHSLDVVKITEVFSFTCPHCNIFNKEHKKLKKEFGERVEFVHYPIGWSGINVQIMYLHAVEENKGPALKDIVYNAFHDSGIRNINDPVILGHLAADIGLKNSYESVKDGENYQDQIKKIRDYITAFEVRSTPTLIIEDSLVATGNITNLRKIIKSLLKK